jgi:hypothetical protein
LRYRSKELDEKVTGEPKGYETAKAAQQPDADQSAEDPQKDAQHPAAITGG